MQSWPLPASSTHEWTEFFKSYQGNASSSLHAKDYSKAQQELAAWADSSQGTRD